MRTGYFIIPFSLFLLTILPGQDLMAAKVYQWKDEAGIVHFSDTPPDGTPLNALREINLAGYGDSVADPDQYSIINQLDRMSERRRQLEEMRIARKKLQLEEKRLAQEREQASQAYMVESASAFRPYNYFYAYPQRSLYSHGRHHRKNRQDYNRPGGHDNHQHRGYRGKHSSSFVRFNSSHLNIGVRF